MNLKTIAIVVSLLTVFSGALYKAWSMDARLSDNSVQLASVQDEVRKGKLEWWQWKNAIRIEYLEDKNSTDPYFSRKIEDLEKQNLCLERAKEIKGKKPIECME